jgi:hypothetical protein
MTRQRSFASSVFLAAIFAFVAAPAVLSQVDTPSISAGETGHAKQTIRVTAGLSGLPSGFTLWWMDDATWNSYDRQWPQSLEQGIDWARFYGQPTLNTFGGQYTTFELGPNESILIEIGDLADESGVTGTLGELEYGTQYHFCAFANDGIGKRGSELSLSVGTQTTVSTNCTYTQGYWKTHIEMWPGASIALGSVIYTQQELLSILNQPVQGNGLVSLAHQLIATKLNVLGGADPTAAASAIASADALIGGLVVPPIGTGSLPPNQTSSLTQTLDDYNNGVIGPGHCGSVSTQKTSWGEVKTLFR